ncbi:uncharacterized protein LOC144111349 [Amblyomma americanum]
MSSPNDTCTVPQLPAGPLAKLLPAGIPVCRPPGKLVQLVAQTIHESPQRALRVPHMYQSSRTTPSSRLSSSSRSLSVHASLPSFIGSPEMQLGHMEPQPLVEQELRTERSAVPPSPSMYLHAKEEWQRSPVYMWSGGSQDLNYCQSKANPGELSRSWDTKLWDEHLSAKKESDASASYEAWEPVPFFCAPTNDTPLPPTSSGLRTSTPGAAAGSWTGTALATRTFI